MTENFKVPAVKPVDSALQGEGVINSDDERLQQRVIHQASLQPETRRAPSNMSPEERAKRKAMLIQSFDRGVVHDRLTVKLPSDLYGEWVRNDPLEIDRMRTLGFEIEREHATNRSLNNDGSGSPLGGDVLFMPT